MSQSKTAQNETERSSAWKAALIKAGHDINFPPLSFVMGHPLVAYAFALKKIQKGGYNGRVYIHDGMLSIGDFLISTPFGRIFLHQIGPTMIDIPILPSTVSSVLAGNRLAQLIEFQDVDRKEVNDAVADLIIEECHSIGKGTMIILKTAAFIPMEEGLAEDDGNWRAMSPVPMG